MAQLDSTILLNKVLDARAKLPFVTPVGPSDCERLRDACAILDELIGELDR